MPSIELREPPPRIATGRRPLMALDRAILDAAQEPSRPVKIADALRAQGWTVTTQQVARRLKAIVARGLAVRTRPEGAPANGPGTSLYRAKRADDG